MIRSQQIGSERARLSSRDAHCVENSRLAMLLPMAYWASYFDPRNDRNEKILSALRRHGLIRCDVHPRNEPA